MNAVDIDGADGVFVPTGPDDRWVYAREWSPGAEPVEDWSITAMHRADPDRVGRAGPVPGDPVGAAVRHGRPGRAVLPVRPGAARRRCGAPHHPGRRHRHEHRDPGGPQPGWKLAWVLRGWAGPSLLDSYEAERRPVGTQAVARSLRGERGPMVRAGRRAHGHRQCAALGHRRPVPGRAGRHRGPMVGARAPHGWIEHRGRRMSTVDLFADKMTLLTDPGGARWRRCLSELVTGDRLRSPSITVGPAGGAELQGPGRRGRGCRAPAVGTDVRTR